MRKDDKHPLKGKSGVEGILGGLGDILGKIADLAEKAETIKKEGSFSTRDGREGRYQVGFNIRTLSDGTGESRLDVQPFGDVTRDASTGKAEVAETREPPTDVFEESDHVLIVVEMPGISIDDATFAVEGDILTISAEKGPKRYRKEVLLPRAYEARACAVSANNGVFEVKLSNTQAAGEAA